MDRAVGDLVNLSEDVGGAGGPLPGSVVRSQFVFGFCVFGGVATRQGFWSVFDFVAKVRSRPRTPSQGVPEIQAGETTRARLNRKHLPAPQTPLCSGPGLHPALCEQSA